MKIIHKFLFLIVLLCGTFIFSSCDKNNKQKIEVTSQANGKYDYAIGLGEKINFSNTSWFENNEIKELVNKELLTEENKYEISSTFKDYIEIEMKEFTNFYIKCISSFTQEIHLDKLVISCEKYEIHLPVDITLKYNENFAYSLFTNGFIATDYFEKQIYNYLLLSPKSIGLSTSDIVTLSNVSCSSNVLEIKETQIAMVKYELESINVYSLNYETFDFPYEVSSSSNYGTYLKIETEAKVDTPYFGGDITIELKINGDIYSQCMHIFDMRNSIL